MHTLQSMFDAVATHAMQMETLCRTTEGCRYRSRNAPAGSDRCFIGALILLLVVNWPGWPKP